MKRKLSAVQQWMADHPDDTPCPNGVEAAAAWRRARGLNKTELKYGDIEWLRSRIGANSDPWIAAQIAKLEAKRP